jgi:hypothetical protein
VAKQKEDSRMESSSQCHSLSFDPKQKPTTEQVGREQWKQSTTQENETKEMVVGRKSG